MEKLIEFFTLLGFADNDFASHLVAYHMRLEWFLEAHKDAMTILALEAV